jgi:adenylate kinase family enzyme
LARRLHILHIELDALFWKPNWKESDREIMLTRVEEITCTNAWVTDGNYGFLRDILWSRAQALVWLDYSLPFILWRLWWRTWRRVITKELLWGINRERLWAQFFNRDSLFLWAWKTYGRHKREYPALFTQSPYVHLKIYHFKRSRDVEEWLDSL